MKSVKHAAALREVSDYHPSLPLKEAEQAEVPKLSKPRTTIERVLLWTSWGDKTPQPHLF